MNRIINPFAFSSSSVNLGSRDFELDNSEYFSGSLNSTINPGDSDFWVGMWVRFETVPSGAGRNSGLMGLWTTGGDRSWLISCADLGSGAIIRVLLRNAADSGNTAFDTSVSLSSATWYFVCFYHDAATNEVGISVDGGAFDTTAYSSGVKTATSSDYYIGWTNSGGIDQYMDGLILNCAFGRPPSGTMATLASTICSALYNSGNALFWESLSSTQKTDWGLTSGNGVWYPLNEINSGDNAVDNVSGLNMTDVNTVGVSALVP